MANGDLGDDMVHQVRRPGGHGAAKTGRTKTAPFTCKGHKALIPTVAAAYPGKAVGQDAAAQITLKLVNHMRWQGLVCICRCRNERLQLLLHHLVEHSLLGLPTLIRCHAAGQCKRVADANSQQYRYIERLGVSAVSDWHADS